MGPTVQPEQSWGLGILHGPATLTSLAWQRGESGPPLPSQSAPSQGPHVEGGFLHHAKAVMSRGKRKDELERNGKRRGGTRLTCRVGAAQRLPLGTGTSAFLLAQKLLGSPLCQALKLLLPQTLPSHSSWGAVRLEAHTRSPQHSLLPTGPLEQWQRVKEMLGGETMGPKSVPQSAVKGDASTTKPPGEGRMGVSIPNATVWGL